MPSRFTMLGILAFWLFASGWLFYRDIWPGLKPGEPPPFVIDLADEASARASQIRWKVFMKGEEKGYAITSVRNNPQQGTYDLHEEYKFFSGGRKSQLEPDQIVSSMFRVTEEGELKELQISLKIQDPARAVNDYDKIKFLVEYSGKVENRRFKQQIEIKIPVHYVHELNAVEVSSHGSVLNPLHPLNRLPRLRAGQRWRMPLVNPFAEISKALPMLKAPEIPWLEARVLPQREILFWGQDDPGPVECLVIEYTGEDVSGRTWVRAHDFVVLQQEVTLQGQQLTLVRE